MTIRTPKTPVTKYAKAKEFFLPNPFVFTIIIAKIITGNSPSTLNVITPKSF